MKKHKILLLEVDDTTHEASVWVSEEAAAKFNPVTMTVVGFLINEDSRWIRLSALDDGCGYLGRIFAVPKKAVRKRRVLRER